MASITVEARNEILAVLVGMFDAAPGSAVLSVLVEATEAGASLNSLANILATKPQFEQVYPAHQTASEFADSLIETLLGNEVTAQQKTDAHGIIVAKLNAGDSRADVIVDAVQLLLAAPGEKWADAKQALLNKVEVSNHYSVIDQQGSPSLADLQAVLANVTSDPASVADAIADIDGGITTTPLNLTVGKDSLNGTSGSDVFESLPIDANGAAASTFNSFDNINGGDGRDTLNIFTNGANNDGSLGVGTVKNVEVVNINNGTVAAVALADASIYQGVEELWQVKFAAAATNLSNGVTAGFRDTTTALTATSVDSATTASVALDNVTAAGLTVNSTTAAGKLDTVNISGDLATGSPALAAAVTLATAAKAITVNTEVETTLTVAGATALASVDASGSTGDLTYVGGATVATIEGGSGGDTLTLGTATSATVNAAINAGDGDDTVTVATSGAGKTTINAGAGGDTVNITGRSTGILTLDLGAGDDTFSATAAINATDVIDGGAGTDTLLLQLVGVANIGAFSNFEVFDANGLAKNLDIDILTQNNTVTEIVSSGDVGAAASLSNLGAGVGYRVTGDTVVANSLTLNQKVAGALTIGLDIDETGTTAVTTAVTANDAYAIASNATSITASFDSDFVGKATGAGDNATQLKIDGAAATELTVVSDGDNAENQLIYTDTGTNKLASVTVTGSSDLDLDLSGSNKVATVDASGLAGGLTFNANDLKAESAANAFDGGVLKLGGGDDVITIFQGAKISGIDLGEEEGATAQDGFDVIQGAGARAADAANTDVKFVDGLATFLGAGPNDLATAISTVNNLLGGGESVVFEYIGNSYVVDNDGASVIQLVGVTGLEGLDDIGGGQLYVF